MAFSRDSRFSAPHRDFEHDKDGHAKNLRVLEAFLEAARDWLPLLKKQGLPTTSDMTTGTDAIVNYNGDLYHFVDGAWVKIHNDVNSFEPLYWMGPVA